ncbi:tetratricopeptide repeat-containing sensor histidine kinase [Sunxiuqinia indica]|uniref:tetratricopeptide repeat-containing sensor histidine kinase n=1 Tax=Sunxiuqinia indica TaxID=2692584 RepID=UPI00135B9FE7|nr:ATP-binding protein [Sunxiuqinia indica]
MLRQSLLYIILFYGFLGHRVQGHELPKSDRSDRLANLNYLEDLISRDLDSAIIIGNTILEESTVSDSILVETKILLGGAYYDLGQKDTSYSILNSVLKQAQTTGNRLVEIKTRTQIAFKLKNDYQFEKAIKHLISAERLLQNSDPIDLRFNILNTLAATHRKMKDYSSALNYFTYLEENYYYQLSSEQRRTLFMNKGNVYAVQKNYAKAEELFNKAYEETLTIDRPDSRALITYNLGALYYRQQKFDKSVKYISESLKSYLKIGDQVYIERCYRVLGAIAMDQGKLSEAESYFLKALDIAQRIAQKKSILGNYKNLYLLYWERGLETGELSDLNDALLYMENYRLMNDSLYKVETAEKILELEKQYETEKKNNQITILEKENELKEDEIVLQRTQRNYLLIVMLLVTGILGIFIYFYYYNRRINRLLQLQGKRILNQRNKISKQNKKLESSISTQNKLFSIIAHDLRSPLVSISNVSKLIGFYLHDKRYGELESVAQMMEQKNEQVLDLTDNLLNWAKSKTGQLAPMFEPIHFSEILEDCMDLYQPIAQAKEIHLSYADKEDVVLWSDSNMLKTICRNLINNAIKFTPRGGSIIIDYLKKKKFVVLFVQDSGVGIPKDKIASLFKIDRAKSTSGTEGEKSSGLGLTVCKEFTEAMKGEIWVESEVGEGSRFCVKLLMFNPDIHQTRRTTASTTDFKVSAN